MRMESPESNSHEGQGSSTETNLGSKPTEDVSNINDDLSSDPMVCNDDLISDPVVCNNDSFSNEKEGPSFDVDNIKKENLENEKDSGDGDKNEAVLEDAPGVEETGNMENDSTKNFEEHFVKVEASVLGDDQVENDDSEEVEIVGVENKSFKPSIFVRRESDLKANQIHCENNDVFIVEDDPVFEETYSRTGSSSVKTEVVDSDDDSIMSIHSDECYDQDVKPSRKTIAGKSNFVDALKNNLKRKSESSETVKVKKPKVPVSASKIASASNQKQAPIPTAGSLPLPGFGKLRNIIGSNFKKLKLNLSETYDAKSELGLSYKHEDPSLDTASSNLNADGTAYECPKCKANFKWKTTLKFHMFNHLEDKALECDVCFKLFLSPAYLNEHKKVHLNENHERNFNCQDCSGQFETEASLSVHKLTHAKLEQKHYVCNVCKEQFKSLFSLNSHKAKHSSAIKYECKPCDLRFKTLKTLTRHIATHNAEDKTKEKE